MSSSQKTKSGRVCAESFRDIDLYELLHIKDDDNDITIRKAFRKRALECHPDKNPDNPDALELFHQLTYGLEILLDISARASYDKILKHKRAVKQRQLQQDARIQAKKRKLQEYESSARQQLRDDQEYLAAMEKLQNDMNAIRQKNSELMELESLRFTKDVWTRIMESREKSTTTTAPTEYRLKIKWKADKTDKTNGGYTEESIKNYLKKYGDLGGLIMSKKPGKAIVEFKSLQACQMAMDYEKGRIENPLQFEWVTPPETAKPAPSIKVNSALDLLRRAEERKRLIAQLEKEDREES